MEKMVFESKAAKFTEECPLNYVSKEAALEESMIGVKMYEAPLIGYGDANDSLFVEMKKKEAVGPQFMLPTEWLPNAKTVISFFLPFSEEVKKSNYTPDIPSGLWLHGRIEGQKFVREMSLYLKSVLESEGYSVVLPLTDDRFRSVMIPKENETVLWDGAAFTSNWSERHVAFICGLGTFGLSKGLITAKGMAGRFGSLITDAPLEATKRAYTEIYEYCTKCGACMRRCPAEAITLEEGKNHYKCCAYVDETMRKYAPRYGCGKCQVKVPCESGVPGRK